MPVKGQGITWTPARKAAALQLAGEGLSAAQIASELGGVSRSAVCGLLFREGYSRPDRPHDPCARFSDEDLLTVLRLADRRVPRQRIGEVIGVSDGTVRAILTRIAADLEAADRGELVA